MVAFGDPSRLVTPQADGVISRSRKGRAAARSQSTASVSSVTVRRPGAAEISFDVLHGARQHVQLVVQTVEFGSCDDEFVVTQLELPGSLAGHPVPLATPLRTELPWAPWSAPGR